MSYGKSPDEVLTHLLQSLVKEGGTMEVSFRVHVKRGGSQESVRPVTPYTGAKSVRRTPSQEALDPFKYGKCGDCDLGRDDELLWCDVCHHFRLKTNVVCFPTAPGVGSHSPMAIDSQESVTPHTEANARAVVEGMIGAIQKSVPSTGSQESVCSRCLQVYPHSGHLTPRTAGPRLCLACLNAQAKPDNLERWTCEGCTRQWPTSSIHCVNCGTPRRM